MSTISGPCKYLAPDRDSSYKQLHVKGRRIFARTLYSLTVGDEGRMMPEEIAADYQIPLEAVQEVIRYCLSGAPEINDDWAMDEARAGARPRTGSADSANSISI